MLKLSRFFFLLFVLTGIAVSGYAQRISDQPDYASPMFQPGGFEAQAAPSETFPFSHPQPDPLLQNRIPMTGKAFAYEFMGGLAGSYSLFVAAYYVAYPLFILGLFATGSNGVTQIGLFTAMGIILLSGAVLGTSVGVWAVGNNLQYQECNYLWVLLFSLAGAALGAVLVDSVTYAMDPFWRWVGWFTLPLPATFGGIIGYHFMGNYTQQGTETPVHDSGWEGEPDGFPANEMMPRSQFQINIPFLNIRF